MSYYDSIHNLFLGRLSSLSKSIILSALKQLKKGKLTIHIQEQDSEDPKETLVFGTEKPEAEITIRSKNVWTRMVVNLDLVSRPAFRPPCIFILQPIFKRNVCLGIESNDNNRVWEKLICSASSNAMTQSSYYSSWLPIGRP